MTTTSLAEQKEIIAEPQTANRKPYRNLKPYRNQQTL